jgi:hypothetical protein
LFTAVSYERLIMPMPAVVEFNDDGSTARLVPTTVRELGKNEQFLEELIAEHPELLELETVGTGIRRPLKVFRQNDLLNALERTIIPDLIIFSASGHVIIVEVKLSDNPELRDRKVLSQVIDYAGAFVDLDEDELFTIFSHDHGSVKAWNHLIESFFPEEKNIDILSDQIKKRLRRGEVDMVVACDNAPPGLNKFLAGISKQSALPFSLMLAEITPYVHYGSPNASVHFISKAILRTEIVSRTAVTVRYEQGSNERPSVKVETTPIDEIEENLEHTDDSRLWTEKEIEEAITSIKHPVVKKLFELSKRKSEAQRIMSPGKKKKPAFGFYIRRVSSDGSEMTKQVFNYRIGDSTLRIYLNMLESIITEDEYRKFLTRLKELFPEPMGRDLREPFIALNDIEEHFVYFEELILSLVK